MESIEQLAALVPNLTIEVPNRRNWFSPKVGELAPSLAADIHTWLAADQGTDMQLRRARATTEGRRRRKAIKPRTVASYRQLILEFIAMELRAGVPMDNLQTLRDAVDLDNVDKGLAAYEEHFLGKKRRHLGQVMRIVCLVARHWVNVPPEHDSQLWAWTKDVSGSRHGMTEKNKKTLLDLRDPNCLKRLLGLSGSVFEEILAKPKIRRRDAVRAQTAFAIALLLNAPARIGNIAEIDLDNHIRRVATGSEEKIYLMIPGDQVKNEEDLLYPLSDRTRELLDTYLARIRPKLLGENRRWLFPGEGSGHKGFGLLSQQIAALTERHVGVRITAHQFRHIAATLLVQRSPNGLHAASKLLGHKSSSTTIQNYAWFAKEEALEQWNGLLLQAERENRVDGPSGNRVRRPRRRRS
jgi:site-specific recombinase XerD